MTGSQWFLTAFLESVILVRIPAKTAAQSRPALRGRGKAGGLTNAADSTAGCVLWIY